MTSYQIVLSCALMACTAALYVDYSKKPSDASTYADANTDQYKAGLYFDPSVKTYGPIDKPESYINQYNKGSQYNKDQYNNQYNKDSYNNQYNKGSQYNNQYNKDSYNNNQYNKDSYNNNKYNKDSFSNQYNKDRYNNQYKKDSYNNQYNKDQYNNQYNKNYNYNAQGDYQQNNYDSTVGVYPCEKGDEGKKYEVIGACYAFFECVYGEALYRQCDDYYRFDAYSGQCVADQSCLYVPTDVPSTYDGNSYNNYPSGYGKSSSYSKHSSY